MRKYILLFILTFFLTGCSNALLADNTVFVLDNSQPKVARINSVSNDQLGNIKSKTPENLILSISHSGNSYYIDQFDPDRNTLVNVISSEGRIFDVQGAKEGFFYTRENPVDDSGIQIYWSSYDKTTERTITEVADNIDPIIYAYGTDRVVYINNGNELTISDSAGFKNTYTLDYPVELSKINWNDSQNIGFIIARALDDDSYNLMKLTITEDNNLETENIANNVLDMDLSDDDSQLVFLQQDTNKTIAYELSNITTTNTEPIFSEDNIERISFSDDSDSFYYSVKMSFGVRSTIWYYEKGNKTKTQVSHPIRLISSIIPIKEGEIIYSIIQQSLQENYDIIQSYNYITNLNFTIE